VRIADHEFGLGERKKIKENSNKLLSRTGFAFGFTKTYNMGKTYQSSHVNGSQRKENANATY
jgi:hypothetical protein